MKVVRVNMHDCTIEITASPKEWKRLGGRALISKIMLDEVDPVSNPLGPNNKLIIAPGILGGTTVSCVNRISIGAKSPLTDTIKESNAGGVTGYKLARLGIKAIIVENLPKEKSFKNLYISENEISLIDAEEYKNMGVYVTAEKLKEKYNTKVGLVINGPAGERLYRNSGIANADKDGVPSRYSGRGGLGAVMGSKGLKAIIIDDSNATGIEIKNDTLFKETRSIISKTIIENEATNNTYKKYGTAIVVNLTNSLGALPTRNFSTGYFEGAEDINGEKLYELITKRKGDPSHACMPGCLIKCSNIFPDENGDVIVSPLEYETIGLMGSNLGIDNLDLIGKLNYICNDLGLDTIEAGGTIGVAMEAGVIDFGDEDGVLRLLDEIRKDTYLGKIIASGASIAGKVLGVRRIPVVKDQALAAYDPRAIKGLGVTYATSNMGADHTTGSTLRSPVDHRSPDNQVEATRKSKINSTIHDCMGTCLFMGMGIKGDIALLADLYSAMIGESYKTEDIINVVKETLLREREFNRRAGFTVAHDRLPEFFYTEVNPATDTVFDVRQEEINTLFEF